MEHDKPSSPLLTVVGVIGSMLIFVLILGIAYLPGRNEPVNQQIVDMRTATKESVDASGAKALNEAALIDAENKIYKIPVDQAVALTIEKLQQY
ncbi:MAG: hypothetical protein MK080_05760 [Opitutales bacterium]|nr:hypothetical protein [Opitutales bacterium]NRA26637.1 hypothetical protein [Opitutales bacterium]